MYGHLKTDVADALVAEIEPIQARFREMREDRSYLDGLLVAGKDAARERASKTLKTVYDCVGFI